MCLKLYLVFARVCQMQQTPRQCIVCVCVCVSLNVRNLESVHTVTSLCSVRVCVFVCLCVRVCEDLPAKDSRLVILG